MHHTCMLIEAQPSNEATQLATTYGCKQLSRKPSVSWPSGLLFTEASYEDSCIFVGIAARNDRPLPTNDTPMCHGVSIGQWEFIGGFNTRH